jgi:hypothetical protein
VYQQNHIPFNRQSTLGDLTNTTARDNIIEPMTIKHEQHRRLSLEIFKPPTEEELRQARLPKPEVVGGPDGSDDDSSAEVR